MARTAGSHRSVVKPQTPGEVRESSQESSSNLLSIGVGFASSEVLNCDMRLAMLCR